MKPEDWQRWGQFTTFKSNAAELLSKELRTSQRIYCSPLVDPYQPAEADRRMMPGILETICAAPPQVFVLQTRGPLVLRDLDLLVEAARRTILRVSFSVPTDRNDVLKLYEPHCPSFEERLDTLCTLRKAGIEAYATLAPLLPSNPERLALAAIEATGRDLIGDPLHVRPVKRHGATTRDAAWRISSHHGFESWLDPHFQERVIEQICTTAARQHKSFRVGPGGFSALARTTSDSADR